MCTPSPPPAPDYKAAAAATASGNQNAALAAQTGNMTNQVGPQQYSYDAETGKYTPTGTSSGVSYTNPAKPDKFGNMPFDQSTLTPAQKQTYAATGELPKGFNTTYLPQQWNQTQTLGANDQQLFNQSQATQLGLSDMALTGLDKVKQAISQGVAPNIAVQGGPATTAQGMTTSVGEPSLQYNINDAGGIQNAIDSGGSIQKSISNNASQINTNAGADQSAYGLGLTGNNADKVKTSLGVDPSLLSQQTVDALYKANTQYLDPQFTQSQAKMESQLANQGITRGSEAYNNAMLNFNNQKQQAYESARNQAIGQGTAAAQGMFGMSLQGAQFGNQALGQQFGQNVTAQTLANSAAGQNNQLALANQQANNAALGQQFSQNQQAGNFANAAQTQAYGQNLSDAQLTNAAQAQQYGQNANDAAFANSAEMQRVQTALQNANLTNEQKQQLYNQALQSAQLSNQASNQQLAQNQAIQQNPLNILQALRTGAQLNTANLPQVGTSQPGQLANWQGADMLGAATAQGQYDQSVYNAQAAANAQMMSAGIGAAGALGGAGIKAASDRRLKKNIKRIGTHVLGIGLYTWDYLWGQPFSGVMADEVEQVMPEAIVMHPSGFKMVNYSMLGLL